MRFIAVNYLISPRSQYSSKKTSLQGFEPPIIGLEPLIPLLQLSLTAMKFLVNLNQINVGKQMRLFFARNAVKCGELIFSPHSPHIHRISYINLPHKSKR